ncbi:hypothetical protein BKA65DRAFT_535715 [Rhexocercosporidium sp. MPI-PUGE-AT-0058]|nr:hypothetical protein BKA65DRAFT_535715 [Rhexocercosporidium sp. MPI-PUGE-AT-0058]
MATSDIQQTLPDSSEHPNPRQYREFNLQNKVFAVTGGGRGLGLALAEALVEAGGQVYCLDRLEKPDDDFIAAQKRADPEFGGSLHYKRIDVRDVENVNETMAGIAAQKQRFDGLIAAAGINHVGSAIDHSPADITDVMSINYTGVFVTATAAAKQMLHWKCRGSIVLVSSMSGLIANKGMVSPVYNSSKAAVIQLGRSLAMEWGRIDEEGRGGIRVNCLCPGHIVTPMVKETLREVPESKELWETENMLGRLAKPEEFRGAALFLLSDASSFMTGSSLVMDGGHTAW